MTATDGLRGVLADVVAEHGRQDERWGAGRDMADGTGPDAFLLGARFADLAALLQQIVDESASAGQLAWTAILLEEVFEALAEDDHDRLRAELVQVAAVAAQWIEAIDRRPRPEPVDDDVVVEPAVCDERAACFRTIGARGTCPCGVVL